MNENNGMNPFEQPVDGSEIVVSGVEKVTKKGKGKKIAAISGISAAVLVGGGAAAYNLSPFVKNQVKLRTMSPQKYLAWVNEENADTFAKSVADNYREMLKKYENGVTSSTAIEYKASDDAKDALLTEILGSDYKTTDDKDDKELIKVVNNVDTISLGVESSLKKGAGAYSVYASLNDDKLLSAECVADLETFDFFARVPQLTEQYIGFGLGDYIAEQDRDAEKILDVVKDVLADPEDYLTPGELEKEVSKYIGIWNDGISKVRLEKSEEVSIADIDVKYTVATVKLDEDKLKEIVRDMLVELQDDDIIMNIVVDKLEAVDEDEYEEFFQDGIDSLDRQLDNADEDYDDDDDDYYNSYEPVESTFVYKTYIDPKGVIRGISFSVESDDDDEDDVNSVSFIIGKDGNEVRGEVVFIEDGEENFRADLTAVEKSKKLSGTIDFTVNDYDYDYNDETGDWERIADPTNVSVEFENFKVVNEKKHYIQGDVTIIVPDVDPISISLESDGKEQRISYVIDIDGKNYGTVSLISSTEDKFDIDVPTREDSFFLGTTDDLDDIDFSKYITEDDLTDFVTELLEKIGLGDELIDEAVEDLVEEIY